MLNVSTFRFEADSLRLHIQEVLGFTHDWQCIDVSHLDIPENITGFVDTEGNHCFAYCAQAKQLYARLNAWESLTLSAVRHEVALPVPDITVSEGSQVLRVDMPHSTLVIDASRDGQPRIEVFDASGNNLLVSGELAIQASIESVKVAVECHSRLRTVVCLQVSCSGGQYHHMRLVCEAGQPFVRIQESAELAITDQWVWKFSGQALPAALWELIPSAGYHRRDLSYFSDQELSSVVPWSQYSQVFGRDGFALHIPSHNTAVGFVCMNGGSWRGNPYNTLRACTRRLMPDQPLTRRNLITPLKMDGAPNPDRVALRGESRCVPAFCVEGGLGSIYRDYALVVTTPEDMAPPEGLPLTNEVSAADRPEPANPFSQKTDIDALKCSQGLLRRLFIQRGIFSLSDYMALDIAWSRSAIDVEPYKAIDPDHDMTRFSWEENERRIDDFLKARVYGFWYGNGLLSLNCVVGRPLSSYLHHACDRHRYHGAVNQTWFDWFSLIAAIYRSDSYFPGDICMSGLIEAETFEPLIQGMANQNFYTDVIAYVGTFALMAKGHRDSDEYWARCVNHWKRQLAYHVYPESGVWEESHTYFQHVLATMLPLFELAKSLGKEDLYQDEALHALLQGAIDQRTPKNDRFDGKRHLIPWGDHSPDPDRYGWVLACAARGIKEYAPDVANILMWLHQEFGGKESFDDVVEPEWSSIRLRGLGYVFRSKESTREVSLGLRSGAAWGHHHEDDGSIQLHGFERELVGDCEWGADHAKALKTSSVGHSRWRPKHAAVTNFRYAFNRGWLIDSGFEGDWEYACAWSPCYMELQHNRPSMLPDPIFHWRTVIRLDGCRYVIIDTCHAAVEQVVEWYSFKGEVHASPGKVRVRDRTHWLSLQFLCHPELDAIVDNHQSTTALSWDIGTSRYSAFLLEAGLAEDSCQKAEAPNIQLSDDTIIVEDGRNRFEQSFIVDPAWVC